MLFESLFLAMCMAVAGSVDILVMLSPYIFKIIIAFYQLVFIEAWIYAFCAFNTKWKLQGVGIIRRVGSIESNMAFLLLVHH